MSQNKENKTIQMNYTHNQKGTYEVVDAETGKVIEKFRLKSSANYFLLLNRTKKWKIVKVK